MKLLSVTGGGLDEKVLKARAFFEKNVESSSLPNTYFKANSPDTRADDETLSLLAGVVEPDWENVYTWETDSIIGVEVKARLTRPVNYATIVEKLGDTVSQTLQQPEVWILFNECKETGETICFLASLLPDESYCGDPALIGSNPERSNYWGIAIYSTIDGIPILGRRFENGEIVGTLVFDEQYREWDDPELNIGMGIVLIVATRSSDDLPPPAYTVDDGIPVICVGKKPPVIVPDFDFYVPPHDKVIFEDEKPEGGTGGGGGRPGDNDKNDDDDDRKDDEPLAEKLFKNDSLPQNDWDKIEQMLKSILGNCMGQNLINELASGDQINITIDLNAKTSNFGSNGITINEFDSSVLLHEMFHYYQSLNVSMDYAGANLELEAYIAQYMFLKNSGQLDNQRWVQLFMFNAIGSNIADLAERLSRNGTLIDPSSLGLKWFNEDFEDTGIKMQNNYQRKDPNDHRTFDENRSFNDNLQNLRNLSKNC